MAKGNQLKVKFVINDNDKLTIKQTCYRIAGNLQHFYVSQQVNDFMVTLFLDHSCLLHCMCFMGMHDSSIIGYAFHGQVLFKITHYTVCVCHISINLSNQKEKFPGE